MAHKREAEAPENLAVPNSPEAFCPVAKHSHRPHRPGWILIERQEHPPQGMGCASMHVLPDCGTAGWGKCSSTEPFTSDNADPRTAGRTTRLGSAQYTWKLPPQATKEMHPSDNTTCQGRCRLATKQTVAKKPGGNGGRAQEPLLSGMTKGHLALHPAARKVVGRSVRNLCHAERAIVSGVKEGY